VAAALTGPDGTFRIAAPRPGYYLVAARMLGWEPLAAAPQFVDSGQTRSLRFELRRPTVLMDTILSRTRGLMLGRLTPGRVWFARHYGMGKGYFFDGLDIVLRKTSACVYFAFLPGLIAVEPRTGVTGIRCNDDGRVITANTSSTCMQTRVDRDGRLVAMDSLGIYVSYPRMPGPELIPLEDVRGVEVFTTRQDSPHDITTRFPPPGLPPDCADVRIWTSLSW
jgi:hypothetical protein